MSRPPSPSSSSWIHRTLDVLDYGCLAWTSLFLPDETGSRAGGSSYLWLYFTSKPSRALFYAGMAAYLGLGGPDRWRRHGTWGGWAGVALLALAAVGNSYPLLLPLLPLHWLPDSLARRAWAASSRASEDSHADGGWWRLLSSDSSGLLGTWWVGVGNGAWFAFAGRNGPASKSIVPGAFFDVGVERAFAPEPEEGEGEAGERASEPEASSSGIVEVDDEDAPRP